MSENGASHTLDFPYSRQTVLSVAELVKLSRLLHPESPRYTEDYVGLSRQEVASAVVDANTAINVGSLRFYRPENVESFRWLKEDSAEALRVSRRDDGAFDVLYCGSGRISSHFDDYYSRLACVNADFCPITSFLAKVKYWARWSSSIQDRQKEAYRSVLESLKDVNKTENDLFDVLPEPLAKQLNKLPDDLLYIGWRGARAILLGEPVPV
jgi:hypothetical protein